QALELLGEATAEAPGLVAVAQVQEGELRDAGPDVGRDEPDPHDMLAVEGAHSERACREMPLALGPLMGDRVLALPLAAPGERAPVALAFLQAGAALHVHCLHALRAIDLADASQLRSIHPPAR